MQIQITTPEQRESVHSQVLAWIDQQPAEAQAALREEFDSKDDYTAGIEKFVEDHSISVTM